MSGPTAVTSATRASIPWWSPQIGDRELELVREVLESNYVNDGKVTEKFERTVAGLLGAKHAVAVTSGTAAIYLALVGVGVGRGDEVLVPDVTFIATANAVVMTGATPVLVDVDPATLNVDPACVEAAITPRTKAILPVHVSGRGADMPALMAIARRHGIAVVEDAAEAFISRAHGRALGTFGDAGCFSFSPNKSITTGQGGLVVTDDDRVYARLEEFKDHGRRGQGTGGDDVHYTVGFNFKLTNLQSAVGLAQLEYLPARLERLKQIYRRYAAGLRGVAGIRVLDCSVDTGESPQWVDALVERRDELDAYLARHNAHCRRFWFPLHTQAPYRRPDEAFPVSTRVVPKALWLPSAFTLEDADVDYVCARVRELLG
jgi:perosamine synthetase